MVHAVAPIIRKTPKNLLITFALEEPQLALTQTVHGDGPVKASTEGKIRIAQLKNPQPQVTFLQYRLPNEQLLHLM